MGRSGSGKTSIAKQLFPEAYVRGFEYKSKCVLDDFPEGLETGEITRALCSVGFASPPDWLKAYSCLSQGEKMRVDIARALCLDEPLIVFDEFTSVVDREVAKVSAFAISKAVRRSKKRFVAVWRGFVRLGPRPFGRAGSRVSGRSRFHVPRRERRQGEWKPTGIGREYTM